MIKTVEKEIKKLENAKERKTNSKNQLEKDLIEIDRKLKELNTSKVKLLEIQEKINKCLEINSEE